MGPSPTDTTETMWRHRARTFDAIASAARASRPSHRPAMDAARALSTSPVAAAASAAPPAARSRDHQRWGASTAAAPFAVASLAAAAAAATGYVAAARDPVRADAASQTRNPKAAVGSLPYDRAQSVADWLLAKGATLPGVHIRPVDAGRAHVEEHGMGLYASKDVHALEPASSGGGGGGGFFGAGRARAGPVTLASIPLALALTSKACVEHEAVGECFRSLMDDDVIDERMAVMLLLILERRRGARSPAAPYVEAIPARFHTPLHYSDDETKGIVGTNLHGAQKQQRKTLELVLRERVRPAGARLFAAMRAWERERRGWFGRTFVGGFTSGRKITEDEFRWAYSAYWSRALSLPIGADPSAPTVEAIVPGIDFANHSCGAPNARWEVRGVRGGAPDPSDPSGLGPRIELLGEFGSLPAPGEEVVISYGDKTNEELLFVHGFADRDNPHDALVLQPPWAVDGIGEGGFTDGNKKELSKETKEERELRIEANRSREALRKFRGLPSQVVLPAVPPARGLAGLDETTVDTLTLWGLSPKALEYELHAEVATRLAGLSEREAREDAERTVGRSSPTVAERRAAALNALRDALDAQGARLEEATGFGQSARGGDDKGARGPAAGSRAAIAAAVKAASERRVDEVVAADPLAPPVVKAAAVYRSGVARMTRRYANEAARWK